MNDNQGVTPSGPGSRASHDASKLSSPKASIPNAAQPLIDALRGLADCDARAGQPLGRAMRTAAAVIERVSEVDYWEGGGEDLLSWVCHGFYETGTRTVRNPHWKPLP